MAEADFKGRADLWVSEVVCVLVYGEQEQIFSR